MEEEKYYPCGFCGNKTTQYLGFDSGYDWGYCDECKEKHEEEQCKSQLLF